MKWKQVVDTPKGSDFTCVTESYNWPIVSPHTKTTGQNNTSLLFTCQNIHAIVPTKHKF